MKHISVALKAGFIQTVQLSQIKIKFLKKKNFCLQIYFVFFLLFYAFDFNLIFIIFWLYCYILFLSYICNTILSSYKSIDLFYIFSELVDFRPICSNLKSL